MAESAAAPVQAEAMADPLVAAWPTAMEMVMIVAAIAVLFLFCRKRWHDWRAVPPRSIGFSPTAGLVLFIGFLILLRLGAGVAASAWGIDAEVRPLSLESQAKLMIGVYAAQLVGVIAFVMLQSHGPRGGGSRRRQSVLKSIACAAIALVLCWPVVAAVGAIVRPIVMLISGKAVDSVAHESLRMILESPVDGWYIALAAMVVLVAPIVEEVMYRGALQSALVQARLDRWLAIAITSAVFASAHATVDLHALPMLFVLSLSFGWAYERSGRLIVPIVMHSLFNAANLGLALLAK